MNLAPGVRLGAYEIVAPLGAGGMGEVYRARDARVGREVAVKILPAEFSSDPERLTRFEQEARASAALNHPNILALFDVGQHQGAPFIVSELLEGQTLRERTSGSPLSVRKAVELAIQIAHGLAAAHEKGIVHRDLKPENVFITSDGRAKILDFGLAKLTQPEPTMSGISVLPTTPPQTTPGVVLGTIGYMSPEQVRGHNADHRSDIFALGALLYEMLSGRRAFGGDTQMDVMSSILKEDPPDLSSTGDRPIPPALARIIDRCMEKNPAARFQSTRDLAFALEGLSTHSGSAVVASGVSAPVAPRKVVSIFAVVAALILLAALPIAVSHLRESPIVPSVVRFTVGAPENTVFAGGNNPGLAFRPAQAISPDGRYMAFLARRVNEPSTLWVRALDSLVARQIAGTEGANHPFWSHDSRFVGFFADAKLKKVDITGGPPQPICDAPNGEGGAWNADDSILFAPSATSPLSRVAASGGEPVPVTKLGEKELSHKFPQFLRDGRRFIFLVQPANEVRLGSLDSTEVKRLLHADSKAMYSPSGYLLFVREQTLMAQPFDADTGELGSDATPIAEDVAANPSNGRAAFSVSESGALTYRTGNAAGASQLVWFDRSGKQLSTLGEMVRQGDLSLSPDGSRALIASYVAEAPDIWMFDVARRLRSKFTLHSAADLQPIWSPTGDRVVFSSARNGITSDLYIKNSTAEAPEEILLDDDLAKFAFSWSPHGEFILYGTAGGGNRGQDLWILPLADRKPRPYMQTQYSEFAGRFSPDGRWIAYRSNESGQAEIYVAPFPGPGEKSRISGAGAAGGYPRWRGDGGELYYLASDNNLMAVPVDGRGSKFVAGEPQALFPTRSTVGRDTFDVSADGQRFLVLTREEETQEELVTVVLNWAAALKN
jgi:Tol biopolymer transport system component